MPKVAKQKSESTRSRLLSRTPRPSLHSQDDCPPLTHGVSVSRGILTPREAPSNDVARSPAQIAYSEFLKRRTAELKDEDPDMATKKRRKIISEEWKKHPKNPKAEA
ncbi:hypothetical protein JCM10212_005750 [Sporobolomyces blumeae]